MNTKGKLPIAPLPYRPQPVPRVLQMKSASVLQPVKPVTKPVAPPVYRPNPALTVLQPKIKIEKDQGKYKIKGRPAFQSHVKKEVVRKWNIDHPTKPLSVKGLNLTKEGLDQCHKTSWNDIRGWVKGYLNKGMTSAKFVQYTDLLYGADQSRETTDEWKTMNGIRTKFIQAVETGKSAAEVESLISRLCSMLNSATPNLRLDDHKINNLLRAHGDPHVVINSQGQASATPISKAQRRKLKGQTTTPLRTPDHGERFYSSSLPKPVSKKGSSPETRGLYFKSN